MSQNGQAHFKNLAKKSRNIFKVCLTILGHYALRGYSMNNAVYSVLVLTLNRCRRLLWIHHRYQMFLDQVAFTPEPSAFFSFYKNQENWFDFWFLVFHHEPASRNVLILFLFEISLFASFDACPYKVFSFPHLLVNCASCKQVFTLL